MLYSPFLQNASESEETMDKIKDIEEFADMVKDKIIDYLPSNLPELMSESAIQGK